jgi:hypothetical protein
MPRAPEILLAGPGAHPAVRAWRALRSGAAELVGVECLKAENKSAVYRLVAERWAYRFSGTGSWHGLSDAQRAAVIGSADLLINVSGSLPRTDEYRQISRLAFVDTDPVLNQIKLLRGDVAFGQQVAAHDIHFSFGERIGETALATRHHWRPTRQPVLLGERRPATPRRPVFTTGSGLYDGAAGRRRAESRIAALVARAERLAEVVGR